MKKLAKKMLSGLVAALPLGARFAVLDRLVQQFGPLRVVRRASHGSRVVGLEAVGDYGRILSAVGDDTIFDIYARTGKWAASTNDTVKTFFVDRSGTYLDIGANIGLTVIPIAKNPGVRCLAFEPDPTNVQNLEQNVAWNCPYHDVITMNLALFSRRDTLQFELSEGNLGDHRLRLNDDDTGVLSESSRKLITVQAVPLDEFAAEVEGPLVVKIDTQGAEPFVVQGAHRVLGMAALLIMEFSPYHLRRLGGDVDAMLRSLQDNFSYGKLARDGAGFGDSMPIEGLVATLVEFWHAAGQAPQDQDYLDVCLSRAPFADGGVQADSRLDKA